MIEVLVVAAAIGNGKVQELPAQRALELAASNKLTVANWLVGMNKPLEITL